MPFLAQISFCHKGRLDIFSAKPLQMLSMSNAKELIDAAVFARKNARASFSNYLVGAAVRTKSGDIIRGCNVEVPILGLSKCAEQVALFAGVAAGHAEFTEIAVATRDGAKPCGACRQVIWDLCGDIVIHATDDNGDVTTYRSKDLLPHAFELSSLPDKH